MTPNEYKLKHSTALKYFLTTDAGRELIPVLHQLAPPSGINTVPHVHQAILERRAGYEICEKAIPFLSTLPLPNEEIEMTYGVEKIVPK